MIDFLSLKQSLQGKYKLYGETERILFNYELVKNINLSPLTNNSKWLCGAIPSELAVFLDEYFKRVVSQECLILNEHDINTSDFSELFKTYLSCLEKLFHDFCFLHGLNFFNYKIEQELIFEPNFTSYSFKYPNQFINFSFISFFSDENASPMSVGFEQDLSLTLAKGLPLIVPHVYDCLIKTVEPTPAIIVNIKGL